jgi:glycosyltransferase involved in cell wall biosynthesis
VPIGVGHALPAIGRAKLAGVDTRLAFPLHAINAQLLGDAEEFAGIIDLIVGVNALQTKSLSRAYPPERLVVVPNGTRPAIAPRKNHEGLRLLFVGRIDEHSKRVFDTVSLAEELRKRGIPFHYTIAGDGPSLAELQQQAPDFEYLGYVTPDDLFTDVYPRADIVTVFSATGEAFVLVAIEGMINGCVPVVSEWPGIHDAGYMRTGFIFPPGDITKAAAAVERLWRDPALLAKMSSESIDIASEFTWSRTRRLWLEAMDALLTRKPILGSFPMQHRVRSGRLDRFPFGEQLRRLFRRYPDFADGWGEWPGTLSGVRDDREGV